MMRHKKGALLVIACALVSFPFIGFSQLLADTTFHPVLPTPAFSVGQGPQVMIDAAHHNYHTGEGRYLPFRRVLEADGYRVMSSSVPFSAAILADVRMLVIANALHESNTTRWSLPTPSAFSDDEIASVVQWVRDGGSLFLIADHMPFPGAAEKLASAFGVTFMNGFARKNKKGPDVFTRKAGLIPSVITEGRNE